MFVYRISEASMSDWTYFEKVDDPERRSYFTGKCVRAALAIKEQIVAEKDWDGDGRYWFAPLPMKDFVVAVECHAYGGGYVVSPVELTWLRNMEFHGEGE